MIASFVISIHALRGEGDDNRHLAERVKMLISIHALRGEGDTFDTPILFLYEYFNPRPPWGGRLGLYRRHYRFADDFNPRPPWGGRQTSAMSRWVLGLISIHALRGEGDHRELDGQLRDKDISIHALRGEGDCKSPTETGRGKHFNPRPPWGGRQKCPSARRSCQSFQSTPSVGRATTLDDFTQLNLRLFQSTPSVGRATEEQEIR